MTERLSISRRDFLNGIALGAAAGGSLSPLELLARAAPADVYPPALTGMRGSHAGSFEVAHAVAWAGHRYPRPTSRTDEVYDLVIVGAGISGLAAAEFYRQRAGEQTRILILDNHDDFGGHAKRNEFTVDGKRLIGYGGSQSIDTPGHYSPAAKKLLTDIGIETDRFYDYFDRRYFSDRNLGRAIHFDAGHYGRNVTAPNVFRGYFGDAPRDIETIVGEYPISPEARAELVALLRDERDHRPDLNREEKIGFLRSVSYTAYLREYAGVSNEVTDLLRDSVLGLWGVGWDALSALEAWRSGMPGTQHLGIGDSDGGGTEREEPYIFHFPDGNAGVARSLLRRLLPDAVPGHTMEDLVPARVDYSRLDRAAAPVRIRLNSTAVNVAHSADQKQVDVSYVRSGEVERVRGRHVIFAAYNAMLPHVCSEVPEAQKEALGYAEKVPLVYISIAIRNWRAFAELGYHSVYIPKSKYLYSFGMDFPVSMGGYRYTATPDEPTIIHGTWVPTAPGQGLSAREQHLLGRKRLYELTFADFEGDIVGKMDGALAAGGFDASRDIAAITVNRWPHGYAYEYNDLSDPEGWDRYNGPHVAGRAQIGRLSIANSDAAGYAYVNGAIDAADRAVNEQLRTA